jgi:hypothetical protein
MVLWLRRAQSNADRACQEAWKKPGLYFQDTQRNNQLHDRDSGKDRPTTRGRMGISFI